jgi:hypothetical protein
VVGSNIPTVDLQDGQGRRGPYARFHDAAVGRLDTIQDGCSQRGIVARIIHHRITKRFHGQLRSHVTGTNAANAVSDH